MNDSTFEIVARRLKDVIDAEFADLNISAVFDNIHESLGTRRREVGIAPMDDTPQMRDRLVQETSIEVKFFDLWDKRVDPEQAVNPFTITAYAERFRGALRDAQATDPRSGLVWFYDVVRIRYPDDPTGNKSRFVAEIRVYGNNTALLETMA